MIKIKALLLPLLLLVSLFSHAASPLHPKEAFKFDAVVDGNSIKATWNIVDDYYLYREKITFESGTPGFELGEPVYPAGKLKHGIRPDGTEGEVETYMGSVTIEVPIIKSVGGEFKFKARSQGCAEELGICYPPQNHEKLLTLAALETKSDAGTPGLSGISDLSSALGLDGGQSNNPLPANQAFKMTSHIEGDTVMITWAIAKDYYMYRDKFSITSATNGIQFGPMKAPNGELKHGIRPDGTEGEVEVFTKEITIGYPIIATETGITKIEFSASGQGCAEIFGICYPPIKNSQSLTTKVSFAVNAAAMKDMDSTAQSEQASNAVIPASTHAMPKPEIKEFVSEQDKSAMVLASGETFKIILYFFLGGLALAFTACMYPMIPILSSVIVGQGEKITTMHAFNLSLFYVLSMAVTFGILGALFAGLAQGINLQAYFQSPWVLVPFSILFVALAFSMFGFYSIQMPASLQGKLSEISSHQKGGSFIGVIIMGVLSALIVGPCAGPVLIGALAYVASEGDVFLGFLSMFILGLGLGLPLIFVGTSHGKFLPKAGGWMDTVKYAAGVVLLAVALLFLERVSFVPTMLIMLAWSALLIIAGVYMGAFEQIKDGASGWRKLWKGLGLVFILYGALVMLGGLTGARNVNDPMHGSKLTMGGGQAHAELGFKQIKTIEDLNRELELAKLSGKYVMLDYYADWCLYCKTFEDYVFSTPEVQKLLADFVLLQADVTDNDELDQALLAYTKVIAPPSILFWNTKGVEKTKFRIVGKMNAEEFIHHVDLILKGN